MNVLYLNGSRCERKNVVSLYNPTFLYGINCFEGIRAYWNESRRKLVYLDLDGHLDRLYESMGHMSFPAPISQDDLEREIHSIARNEEIREDVYIRITVFIGEDGSWHNVDGIHYMVSIRSHPSKLGTHSPIRVGISRFRRISANSMPPQVKAGANYLNSRYALLDVRARGFEDALFLTESGVVSEATGSTVFFIKQGAVHTPSFDCDLLRGITRKRIITICNGRSIPVHEECIDSDSIHSFEGAFLVGSSIEIKQVAAIEDNRFTLDHPIYLSILQDLATRIEADALD